MAAVRIWVTARAKKAKTTINRKRKLEKKRKHENKVRKRKTHKNKESQTYRVMFVYFFASRGRRCGVLNPTTYGVEKKISSVLCIFAKSQVQVWNSIFGDDDCANGGRGKKHWQKASNCSVCQPQSTSQLMCWIHLQRNKAKSLEFLFLYRTTNFFHNILVIWLFIITPKQQQKSTF